MNLDKSTHLFSFDILNLLPNQTLLEFAQICYVDLGDTEEDRDMIINLIKNLPFRDNKGVGRRISVEQ